MQDHRARRSRRVPLGPSRAFCADHGRRDPVGVARGGREPTPSARRRDRCQVQAQALRGRCCRAPTFLSATAVSRPKGV